MSENHGQKPLWVGIGSRKAVTSNLIYLGISQAFRDFALSLENIAGVASVNRKAHEPGLIAVCQMLKVPLITYPIEVLAQVDRFMGNFSSEYGQRSSQTVQGLIGLKNVAEAAAIVASATNLPNKTSVLCTLSVGSTSVRVEISKEPLPFCNFKQLPRQYPRSPVKLPAQLIVPKQIYQKSVTIAVATSLHIS